MVSLGLGRGCSLSFAKKQHPQLLSDSGPELMGTEIQGLGMCGQCLGSEWAWWTKSIESIWLS